jgi:hypothetical protein
MFVAQHVDQVFCPALRGRGGEDHLANSVRGDFPLLKPIFISRRRLGDARTGDPIVDRGVLSRIMRLYNLQILAHLRSNFLAADH